jgi:hypothetical protein
LVTHRIQPDAELTKFVIEHLYDVYLSAKRVFDGQLDTESVFADDVREFTRFDQQELKALVGETLRMFVGPPDVARPQSRPPK